MKNSDRPLHMTAVEAAALICKILNRPMHIVRDHAPRIGYECAVDDRFAPNLVLLITTAYSEYKVEVLGTDCKWVKPKVRANGRLLKSDGKRDQICDVLEYFMAQTDGNAISESPGLFVLRHGLYRLRLKFPYVFG